MKFHALFGLLFSLLISVSPAQADQNAHKDLPPLKPLHSCQDSEGVVKAQIDECEAGKTEVSSISTIRNGKVIHAPLGATLDTWDPDAKPKTSAAVAGTSVTSDIDQPAERHSVRIQVQYLFFASLVVAVIAAMRGRSVIWTFLVCFLGGAVLSAVITGAGTGVGGNAALVGSFAVPALMLLRTLFSRDD